MPDGLLHADRRVESQALSPGLRLDITIVGSCECVIHSEKFQKAGLGGKPSSIFHSKRAILKQRKVMAFNSVSVLVYLVERFEEFVACVNGYV